MCFLSFVMLFVTGNCLQDRFVLFVICTAPAWTVTFPVKESDVRRLYVTIISSFATIDVSTALKFATNTWTVSMAAMNSTAVSETLSAQVNIM